MTLIAVYKQSEATGSSSPHVLVDPDLTEDDEAGLPKTIPISQLASVVTHPLSHDDSIILVNGH